MVPLMALQNAQLTSAVFLFFDCFWRLACFVSAKTSHHFLLVVSMQPRRTIESYLLHRPEMKEMFGNSRSFEEAASMLQEALTEKQVVQASLRDELDRLVKRLRALELVEDENETLRLGLAEHQDKVAMLREELIGKEAMQARLRDGPHRLAERLRELQPLKDDNGILRIKVAQLQREPAVFMCPLGALQDARQIVYFLLHLSNNNVAKSVHACCLCLARSPMGS